MGWFKTDAEKAAEKAEKAALKRIKTLRGYQSNIKKKGPAAMDIESIKSDYDSFGNEIKKIKRDNLKSKAIQEAKLENKFQLRKTKQNKTSGNNSVLAGIQKTYVANNKNKKKVNTNNKVIVKKTTNSSSPTQRDRNKFSNKTKSLKSKTFASKQKAFNKKYRA